MKRALTVLAFLAVVGLVSGQVWAEDGDAPAKKPARTRKPRPPRKPTLRGAHAQMAKVCSLSEDQVKQILALMAERTKAQKAWQEANGEKYKAAYAKYKAAREAKDKEASKKAGEELAALRKGQNAIVVGSQAKVLALLDDEQKAKWRTYNAVRTVKGRFRGVKFSDEQVAQIEALCAKAGPDLGSDDRKKRYAAQSKLVAQVEREVLTKEQRTDVAVAMIKRTFRKAKLTDEQLAQVKAAYVKHTTGVDLADRKAKAAADAKVYAAIRKDILTDEQRKAVAPARRPRPPVKPKPNKDSD